ncbi:hypothetical protein M0804_004830 [Polistes exclamans]|nr:hypothetical protein M0804_004830 [Polistes exclamans]
MKKEETCRRVVRGKLKVVEKGGGGGTGKRFASGRVTTDAVVVVVVVVVMMMLVVCVSGCRLKAPCTRTPDSATFLPICEQPEIERDRQRKK